MRFDALLDIASAIRELRVSVEVLTRTIERKRPSPSE